MRRSTSGLYTIVRQRHFRNEFLKHSKVMLPCDIKQLSSHILSSFAHALAQPPTLHLFLLPPHRRSLPHPPQIGKTLRLHFQASRFCAAQLVLTVRACLGQLFTKNFDLIHLVFLTGTTYSFESKCLSVGSSFVKHI